MRKAVEHATRQAKVYALHREDLDRTEIDDVELKEIRDTYYRQPEVSNFEEDEETIRLTFRTTALANPEEYGTVECECGDDLVDYVCYEAEGENFYCGMCANIYLAGHIDALNLAHQIFCEFENFHYPTLRPGFETMPAWRPNLYPLHAQE